MAPVEGREERDEMTQEEYDKALADADRIAPRDMYTDDGGKTWHRGPDTNPLSRALSSAEADKMLAALQRFIGEDDR
ncbi:hypothetical protein ES703_120757 [subsurface metagenome]